MSPLIHRLAAAVHDAYMAEKRAQGVTELPSRHGTGDLLRDFDELDPADQADDVRTVQVVLRELTDMPWVQVCNLLLAFRDDAGLLAELRGAANVVDPVPDGLADRCRGVAAREDGQR